MNFLSFIVYIPLQIVFIPIAILGLLVTSYKQILVSKKLGLSMTAIEIVNGRWTMHIFGMRKDDATARLVNTLPNTSPLGIWLILFPLWLKYKISGRYFLYPRIPEPGEETMADMVPARTLYFDQVIERIAGQIEQFVVMGAGYDMRAYGDLQERGIEFFELDQPGVQQHKISSLEAARIPREHVNFVSVDFGSENAIEKLVASGFDASKKTLFLWEGVTLYLSEADVRKTMGEIRNVAAAGSVLLADYYSKRILAFGSKGVTKKMLDQTNEDLVFGMDFATNYEEVFSEFVRSESMSVGETFFMGANKDKGPFMVVAEITI